MIGRSSAERETKVVPAAAARGIIAQCRGQILPAEESTSTSRPQAICLPPTLVDRENAPPVQVHCVKSQDTYLRYLPSPICITPGRMNEVLRW
jgi:hypothetical protein